MLAPSPQSPAPPPPIPSAPVVVNTKDLTGPSAVYEGFVNKRKELSEQLESLQETRQDISRQLQNPEGNLNEADKLGLQKRITSIDTRIEEVDKQLAVADAQVASAAAVPGAIVEPPRYVREGPPEEFFVLGGIFMFVAILPISIAYARRIWRRGAAVVAALPSDIVERFSQLDQAVESIAVEVERIGEGQRFITRVLSEQGTRGALGEGAARPVEVRERDSLRQRVE